MKQKWEYKKLGDVATFINGYPFKPSEWTTEGLPIIRIQNLNNPFAEYNYFDKTLDGRYIVKSGDVLISWSGTLGVYEWSGKQALLNQHIFKVLFDKGKINKAYFKYVVSSRIEEMKSKVHGITMQHITKGDFDKTTIPVPPLDEQQRIVAELDLLTEVIDKRRMQLKELDTLAQSIFYDMFGDPIENEKGWEVKKLGDVCVSITDGDHMPPPKSESGVPFLTISDIDKENRQLNFENTFFVPQSYFESLKEDRVARIGDLLYTVTGSYGIPVVVSENRDFCFQRHIALIRPQKDKLNTNFLCYWALCKSVKLMADGFATGIAQKTVGLGSIRKFTVILPPLALQQSFADKIQSIEKQKSVINQSIVDTQKLLDYTMDKYFG